MMKKVTDRRAVEAAMDEFDQLGRAAFLEKHGFHTANRYFVKRNGRRYDSKAIYGVAHQIQFSEDGPKGPMDFSGGERHVQGPLEALGFEFEVDPDDQADPTSEDGESIITSRDVLLIGSSRSKQRYADLSEEERDAYIRVSDALQTLGDLFKSKLTDPSKFEVRTTSGFHPKSGIRGGLPKDLWFGVCAAENLERFAGNPQVFMIVSDRGIELGYAATTHPADFSNSGLKKKIWEIAPQIYNGLPSPHSAEADEIANQISESGDWRFRKKSRQEVNSTDFGDFHSWLSYFKSPDGKKKAGGTISRYILPDECDSIDLREEVQSLANNFQVLLRRSWHSEAIADGSVQPTAQDVFPQDELDLEGSNEFGARLSEFMKCYGEKRVGAFGLDDELGAAMRNLQSWLEKVPAVADRPTIKVKVSVGQGGGRRHRGSLSSTTERQHPLSKGHTLYSLSRKTCRTPTSP